jgi:hypothetical protein
MLSKILFLILPLPFILSQYSVFDDYNSFLYLSKHLLVIIIFLLIFLKNIVNIKRFILKKFKIMTILMVFITYLFINLSLNSIIQSEYIYYILSIFIMFFVVINLNTLCNLTQFKYIYFSLLFCLFGALFYSLVFDINLYGNWINLTGDNRIRWLFGFNHPGYLASYFLVLSILSFILVSNNILAHRHYIIIFISLIIIILTDTRNSLFTLIIFLLVSTSHNTFRIFKIIGILVTSLFIATILTSRLDILNIYSSNRLGLWTAHFISNYDSFNILFGTGFGNVERMFHSSNTDGKVVQQVASIFHVDNYYFEIFLQFGLVGLLLLLIFIIYLYLQTNQKQSPDQNRVLLGILISIMFYGLFDSALISSGNIVPIVLWSLFFQLLFVNKEVDPKNWTGH